MLWFGLYTVWLNAAERRVDAGTAAMLVNLGPILIAVLAGIFLREGFPRRLVTGLVVALGGVVTIGFATSTGQRDTTGLLLALAAAALYAVGVLLQKQALASTQPLPATWLGCLAGARAGMLTLRPRVPARARHGARGARRSASRTWASSPTAIAFLTWAYALEPHQRRQARPAHPQVVPALAVLLSWLLLSETPTPLALVGGALCLAGVAITRLPARFARARHRSSMTCVPRTAAPGATVRVTSLNLGGLGAAQHVGERHGWGRRDGRRSTARPGPAGADQRLDLVVLHIPDVRRSYRPAPCRPWSQKARRNSGSAAGLDP